MLFVIYRKAGDRPGEIVRKGHASPFDAPLQLLDRETDENDILLADGTDAEVVLAMMDDGAVQAPQFVSLDGDAPSLTDRPAMLLSISKTEIVADGKDAATITRMPDGAKLIVNGSSFDPVDGAVSLTSDIPQTFEIIVSCWPYADFPVTIEAA